MKVCFIIVLLFVSTSVFAQRADTRKLQTIIGELDKALIDKDSVALKRLLNDQLTYGHSNGWIERKNEVIGDLFNDKLTYKRINTALPDVVVEGNTASVRTVADIDVEMEGKAMSLKLKVLQVWVWNNKHWELFARQSVKL